MFQAWSRFLPLIFLGSAAVLGSPMKTPPAPLTDDEMAKFGRELAGEITRHDFAALAKNLDSLAFVNRAIAGMELGDEQENGFRMGIIARLKETVERSFSTFENGRFLRLESRGGDKRVLVRCIAPNGAVNYFSFACARRASGAPKWIDVYDFFNSEDLSALLRRILAPIFVDMNRSPLEKKIEGESVYVQGIVQIGRIASLFQQKKYSESLAAIRALPEEVQQTHFVRLIKVRVTQQLDDAEYLKAIEEMEKAEPNDAAINMVQIDGELLRKNYSAAIQRTNELNERMGGDAYQEYLIGNIYHLAGNPEAARRYARRALTDEPTLLRAYDLLLLLSRESNNNTDLVDLLQEIETKFPKLDMATQVEKDPNYATLRASPIYAEWLRTRAQFSAPRPASSP